MTEFKFLVHTQTNLYANKTNWGIYILKYNVEQSNALNKDRLQYLMPKHRN